MHKFNCEFNVNFMTYFHIFLCVYGIIVLIFDFCKKVETNQKSTTISKEKNKMNLTPLQLQISSDPAVWFVCLLGVGVVFFGLVLLVVIVSLMNFFVGNFSKSEQAKKEQNTVAPVDIKIENKQEILAAVCAAIAEENGTDISAIRVLSFKKVK